MLHNIADALQPSCSDLVMIVDDRRHSSKYPSFSNLLVAIAGSQVKLTIGMIRDCKLFNIVFVHSGGHWLILPILVAKMLHKKLVMFHMGGDKSVEERFNYGQSTLNKLLLSTGVSAVLNLTYSLADRIVCQSQSIASLQLLRKQRDRIFVAKGGGYVEVDQFKMTVPLDQRRYTAGYIGALKPVKGVLNFLRAVPFVSATVHDARFIIAGQGPMKSRLEAEVHNFPKDLAERLTFLGWIDHSSIPEYLNQLKLLVLPSFSEGIPLILQEAMACGTIVLATSVGGVPDLVEDGVSGFIIKDNHPKSLAETIAEVLNREDLPQVAIKARTLVEREYSMAAVAEKYAELLAVVDSTEI